jgi:hypothetical protein
MAARRNPARDAFTRWLDDRPRVGREDWAELLATVPAKASQIRRWCRESGRELDAFIEGVRQDSFAELQRTLTALEAAYQDADSTWRQEIRQLVIVAKEHARWAARRSLDPPHRREKEEMVQWMLVWLESPELFPTWSRLRRAAQSTGEAGQRPAS